MTFQKPAFLENFAGSRLQRILSMVGKTALTIGLILVIAGCIVACVLTVYLATSFEGEGSLPDVDMINQNQTSIVMIQNESGQFVEYQRIAGVQREWANLSEIPVNLQNAVVAIEDERFNEHYGVDWKRTISAVANLVLHFNDTEYGGSTLTQQLVKNLTDNDDHTIQRKVTEIFTAIEMEEFYTKDEILQAYLNIIPLTGTIEGVGAGAKYYFNKEVSDLTLAECAVLASITNNPGRYSPYTHPKALIGRQQTVLFKMHELGFITTDEYQQALGEELHFAKNVGASQIYDYYTDMLIDEVVEDLVDTYGYTESQAKNMVFYGGLTIYSCEDPTLQAKAEAVYKDDANFPDKIATDEEDPQAAIYVMDYTGKTVAVVGGRGEKTANRVLNRATTSMRQPGSSIKPIAVYAPAVQLNLINFSSPVKDCYIVLPDGSKWPRNYNQSRPTDSGMTVIDKAIQSSMNTVPAQLLQLMTPQRSFDFLTGSLKLSSLVTSDNKGNTDIDYAPMGLGGMTKGVYPQEMAAAYQIFGNGGIYNEPYSYTRVEQNGEVILTKGPTNVQVLDTNSAYVMNRLLQNVIQGSYGATARALKGSWKDWEIFAKTGTTQENNDVWLVGGTTQYVAASWFGYDKNQELTNKQTSAARNLWNKVMLALRDDAAVKTFDSYAGSTVEAVFCYETGLLATDKCTKTGTGVYKPDHMPEVCTHGETALPLPVPETSTTTEGTTATTAPAA
ncbi:MAG: penicillin-binding protein [Clostridia bacterium]|nr:penicillin-binding protein [Clostridia bacterium]